MTAPVRARSRAPWIALPLIALLLAGATPAVADELPAPAPTPAAETVEAPAPAPEPAPAEPTAEPAPAPADPTPADPTEAPAAEMPADPEPTEEPAAEPEPTETPLPEPEPAAARQAVAAAAVTAQFSATPSSGLTDGATVTVTATLPATITSTTGSELVTGVYVMYCAQPAGTVGTAGGRATGALCDAGQQRYLVASAGPAGGTVAGSVVDGAWTFSTTIAASDAFGAHECLAATEGGEQCGVFFRLYHGFHAGNVTDPYAYDRFLPLTFAAPPPVYTPGVTVTPTTDLADGDVVTVAGQLPATITSTAGAALTTGVYVMYCVQPTGTVGTPGGRATGAQCDSTRQQYLVASAGPAGGTVSGSVTNGVWSFSVPLTVADGFGAHECLAAAEDGEQCGVFVRLYHGFHAGNVADPYAHDQFVPVTFLAESTGGPGTPGNPSNPGGPGNPGTGTPRPSLSVSPSTIDPAVATTVVISGSGYSGAGAANGVYVSIGSSSVWQPGQVPSQGGWVVSGWVQPSQLTNGSFTTRLTIPAGALAAGGSYGVATFAAHGLALTNRSLDAWRPLTVGAAGSSASAGTSDRSADATPPSDEGIELSSTTVTQGGSVTASASGFEPNETGILVVVYSEPVVLDNDARADAAGVVRWTGRLPLDLSGAHTLTFQGSIDAGVPVEIVERAALGCVVEDARLEWGFKESFRSYVSGTIANGEWTTSGEAGYETPTFSWAGGAGDRDEATDTVVVGFDGAVRFTGHDGALDTTIANPRIEVGDDTALLLLDVEGTTQDGRDLVRVGVEFAELDLAGIDPAAGDGVLELTGIPAELTAAGAEVFGTYPAGEPLDPVTLVLPEGACAGGAVDAENPVAAPAEPVSSTLPSWVLWVVLAALLALVAVVTVLILRRRRV